MKKIIYILLILFALGCQTKQNETIKFLNEGVEKSNVIIEDLTSVIYSNINAKTEENPTKFKQYLQVFEAIKESQNELETFIYSFLDTEEIKPISKEDKLIIFKLINNHKSLLAKTIDSLELDIDVENYFDLDFFEKGGLNSEKLNIILNRTNNATYKVLK
ncbi:MAG: hypothetical protein JXL97_04905 [Bacteroidales bacterium]|nr:hypothetical protein [Bacteroidales bacterium]